MVTNAQDPHIPLTLNTHMRPSCPTFSSSPCDANFTASTRPHIARDWPRRSGMQSERAVIGGGAGRWAVTRGTDPALPGPHPEPLQQDGVHLRVEEEEDRREKKRRETEARERTCAQCLRIEKGSLHRSDTHPHGVPGVCDTPSSARLHLISR